MDDTEDFDDKAPDRPLAPEEQAQARLLTAAELQRIDQCILSNASNSWHKVARIIAMTMGVIGDEFRGLPDVFYSTRIKHLVESGALEASGNLNRMRHSEVRIADQKPGAS